MTENDNKKSMCSYKFYLLFIILRVEEPVFGNYSFLKLESSTRFGEVRLVGSEKLRYGILP